MQYSKRFTGAAVLLALAPSALALGTATLVNACGFDVYYASTSGSYEAMTLLPAGASFSAGYDLQGVGVSVKVSPNDSLESAITQFEYTWAGDKINYDISNINGNPFASNGMALTPSMSGDPNNPTCLPVDCPAGPAVCAAAYNEPNDVRTMVCSDESSLTFVVCAAGAKAKREPEAEANTSPNPAILHSHQRVHARHLLKK